jgi:hypothetical protein
MNNTVAILCLSVAASACFAQEAKKDSEAANASAKVQTAVKVDKAEPRFFKLDFVVKEVDGGKVLNSRSYSIYSATESVPSSIRTGVKVQEGNAEHPNWVDIGVRVDVRSLREMQNQLAFNATAEITGVPPAQQDEAPGRTIMRQYIWSSDVIVPLNKPTVIFSSDSTTSKAQMQVELTAVRVM